MFGIGNRFSAADAYLFDQIKCITFYSFAKFLCGNINKSEIKTDGQKRLKWIHEQKSVRNCQIKFFAFRFRILLPVGGFSRKMLSN